MAEGCPICGFDCSGHPDTNHKKSYPFLTGGRDPLAGQLAGVDFVYAPRAIYDRTPGVERCVYGAGDPVPMADAIRYGLVAAPEERPEPQPAKRKRGRPRKATVQAETSVPPGEAR